MRQKAVPGRPEHLVADTTAQLGTRMAIFGFGMFVALVLIDRLPRLSDRPPGPYSRGQDWAAKLLVPASLLLGVVGLGMWFLTG